MLLLCIIVIIVGVASPLHSAVADHCRLISVVLASLISFSPLSVFLSHYPHVLNAFAFPKAIIGIHSKRFSWVGFVSRMTYPKPSGTDCGDKVAHLYPSITRCSL
jgi:hypothetical protein